MEYVHLDTFTNYIDAHIIQGRLESEQINCWLKDENTVTIDPILTQAVGGIKLMVATSQVQRALELLEEFRKEKQAHIRCLRCSSRHVEFVTTPRKPSNWLGAIFGFLFGDLALSGDKVYHCFDCGNEFSAEELEKAGPDNTVISPD